MNYIVPLVINQDMIFTIAGAITKHFPKLQNECGVITVSRLHPCVPTDLLQQEIHFEAITVFFATKTENGFFAKEVRDTDKMCH